MSLTHLLNTYYRSENRADKHNEVWAGEAVNMAAKLASLSKNDGIHISDSYFNKIISNKALFSCTCGANNEYVPLWNEIDLSEDDRFSFYKPEVLRSKWCKTHGLEYLETILAED